MQPTNKGDASREAIVLLEQKIESLKSEAVFLLQTDPRVESDVAYKEQIVSRLTINIEKFQEQIQVHQRTLLQHQPRSYSSVTAPSAGGRVTRSRAAASDASLSKVAANIQQASRQALTASRTHHATPLDKPVLSEEDQKRSVETLLAARQWLIMRERQLDSLLDSPAAVAYPPDVFQEFLRVQSVRILTESICDRRASQPSDMDTLRQVVKFVASRQ
jgi:hypothetical protein